MNTISTHDLKSSTDHISIAIIGLAGRFPKANSIDAFWKNLRSGKECITRLNDEDNTVKRLGYTTWPHSHPYMSIGNCVGFGGGPAHMVNIDRVGNDPTARDVTDKRRVNEPGQNETSMDGGQVFYSRES